MKTKVKHLIYGKDAIFKSAAGKAVVKMTQKDVRHLAVLEPSSKKLIGILTMSDILRIQAQTVVKHDAKLLEDSIVANKDLDE